MEDAPQIETCLDAVVINFYLNRTPPTLLNPSHISGSTQVHQHIPFFQCKETAALSWSLLLPPETKNVPDKENGVDLTQSVHIWGSDSQYNSKLLCVP